MKNKYNPFKMWGSWIGLVIGLLIAYNLNFPAIDSNIVYNLVILFIIIVSFLIGWVINILWRKFK